MALTTCKECNKEISNKAKSCPHCGAIKNKTSLLIWIIAIFILYIIFRFSILSKNLPTEAIAINEDVCTLEKIKISNIKASFVNECIRSDCYSMKGAFTITNECKNPIGIQLKMTGFDKDKKPVSVRELWPDSTRNNPIGIENQSLEGWLDYDPTIKSFHIEPTRLKEW